MIRQWSVYRRPGRARGGDAPYVVVVQSHHTDPLATVLVAPLLRTPAEFDVGRLTVRVEVEGESLAVYVPEMAAVPRRLLVEPVGDLGAHEDDLRRAIDRLLTGF